jgi:hypothetical protein
MEAVMHRVVRHPGLVAGVLLIAAVRPHGEGPDLEVVGRALDAEGRPEPGDATTERFVGGVRVGQRYWVWPYTFWWGPPPYVPLVTNW